MSPRGALALALLLLSGCREEILHDLDELRANQVRLVLERAGVPAEKRRSGALWNVRVDAAHVAKALATIDASRILVRDLTRFTEQGSGLVPSRGERVRAEERERARGLEQTLERMPGVLEARVHLTGGGDEPFRPLKENENRSGSVFLVTETELPEIVERARQLVAGGAGISNERVAIITSLAGGDLSRSAPTTATPIERSESPALPPVGAGLAVGGGSLALCLLVRAASARSPKGFQRLGPGDARHSVEPLEGEVDR